MKTPRLHGAALRAVRRLSETALGVRALRASALSEFGFDALQALPVEARPVAQVAVRPLQASGPRTWADAELGAPAPGPSRRTAAQLVAAFAAKRTTPSAVLSRLLAHLQRGQHGDATHSPFVVLDEEGARRAAEVSTQRYREGRPLGALDGVPVPVKDHFDMVGLPTRGGTAYLQGVATEDAFLVGTLRRQGAVVVGKTHLTEWGMTPTGHNPHFLMPRNPYRGDRAAGGSSTGSAVAVALGYATVAVGSDGGGSIRIPSALNGVFGLKPTFLRISRTGDIFGGTVGHTGPLAQGTQDLVDFLAGVTSELDPEDVLTRDQPDAGNAVESWRRALGRGVKGCRVGVPRSEWRDAAPAIQQACEEALRALEKEGAQLVDVELPGAANALAMGALTIGCEARGNLDDDLRTHKRAMSDDLVVQLRILETVGAREYFLAQRTRTWLRRNVARALAEVDVLALPSTACLAPTYSRKEDRVHISDTPALLGLCRYAFLANLTGLPAGSVPVGMAEGLPVGLQLLGDAWDEASVLAVMAHLERLGVAHLPPPPGRFDLLG
ncbi:MAG: amidase [Myxococcaceae bacterium]|nr:amidase [Myxococcaceae bacterium]MCI0673692.1 amidase [Myxococcaceae bacterium]